MFYKEHVLEETINGEDEWIVVLASRSSWCLTTILLRKETDHNSYFALNIFLSIRPVPVS